MAPLGRSSALVAAVHDALSILPPFGQRDLRLGDALLASGYGGPLHTTLPWLQGCEKRTNGWVCFTLQVVSCLPCNDVSGNGAKYLAILMAPCPDGLSTDSPANNNVKRGRLVVNLKAVLHIVLAQP